LSLTAPGLAPTDTVDAALLADYAARLAAIRYEATGWVQQLVLSPAEHEHVCVARLEVLPGVGPVGQYPGKQWWQGKRVPGRQISAVSADVLDVLEIPYAVPGDNIIVRGMDLSLLRPGDTLRIGDAFLVATQTPHRPCSKLAARTSPTKKAALAMGRLRGILFDALRPATLCVGDAAELMLLPGA